MTRGERGSIGIGGIGIGIGMRMGIGVSGGGIVMRMRRGDREGIDRIVRGDGREARIDRGQGLRMSGEVETTGSVNRGESVTTVLHDRAAHPDEEASTTIETSDQAAESRTRVHEDQAHRTRDHDHHHRTNENKKNLVLASVAARHHTIATISVNRIPRHLRTRTRKPRMTMIVLQNWLLCNRMLQNWRRIGNHD